MRIERRVTIHRPVSDVFRYVSEPGNDPAWVPVSLRHERTSPGPMGIGATTEEDVGIVRWPLARYAWEVVEHDPPRSVAYRSTAGVLPSTIRMRLAPDDDGTVLELAAEVKLTGAVRLAAPLLGLVAGNLLRWQLRALKRLLERPDGIGRSP